MTVTDALALRKAEERYRLLVDSVRDYAVFALGTDGTIETWNRGAETLTGYSPDEIIGKHYSLLLLPEHKDQEKWVLELEKIRQQGRCQEENWRLRKDGSRFWAEITANAIYDEAGNLIGFTMVLRDLTGEKKSKEALQASFKALSDIKYALDASTIVAITDQHGIITYVNEAFENISKYSRQELIGKTHRIINSGFHPKAFFEEMWHTITSGQVWKGEIRNRAKDGSYYWVDTTIVPLVDTQTGKPYQYVAIRHDITRRKQMDEELQTSLKEVSDIRHALDQSTIVAITDPKGEITYVNDAFCRISKYSREELLGQNHRIINSHYHPHEFFVNMWKTIASGQIWRGEIRNRAKDGSFYWVDTTIVPQLKAVTGKPFQYIAIRHDITPQKTAEEEVRQLNLELETRVHERTEQLQAINKEMEAFSYSVSHDLRAPLRSIDGFSNLVLQTKAEQLDDEGKEYLDLVRSNAQQMAMLIDDLLNLSRLSRTEILKEEFNLADIAKEIIEQLQGAEPERQVEVHIEEPLPTYGDPHLLRAALFNLLSNAWKFTGEKEKTVIELESIQQDGKTVYFVRDNGAGFDMAYSGKLFGAFQRLHDTEEFPGTGVGLATVQRIIHRHGGQIWAEGEVDKGATFYFTVSN